MKFLLSAMTLALCLGVAACDDDSPANPDPGASRVSLSLSTRVIVSPSRAESNVVLTRARLLLRDLKLHQVDAPEETEFVTGPMIVDLDLGGSLNEIVVTSVPVDAYDEVRFKIHKLDDDDPRDRQVLENPLFADFAGPDRYSVIIEGSFDDGTGPFAFNFVSDLNDEQRTPLTPPLVLSEDDRQVNVTLVIDTSRWFDDGFGGTLDPNNRADTDRIEENIESSIDIFEDRDRDGRDDSSDR